MSGIATGTALLIGSGVAAAGGIGSAALESSAANKAASTQASAANRAATLQADLGQESLQDENYQYQQARADQLPYLQSGANSLSSLDYLLGLQSPNGAPGSTTGAGSASNPQTLSIPGVQGGVTLPGVSGVTGTANTNLGAFGSLMQGYQGGQFTAPTAAQAQATPGYQFALNQREGALQAGAAANGSLLTGGTLNAEQQYGQGLANTNYNNVYNQALQQYNTNYNVWANQQANQFNRLATLAGAGQTSAQQLGSEGLQSAGQVANTLSNTGQQVGQQYNNAAAATASGYIGSANAWGQGIGGATGNLSQLALLSSLMKQGGGGSWPGSGGQYSIPGVTPGADSGWAS
jgi:hypothetical protein